MCDLAQKRLDIKDIEKQMVKCRYCHQDVQFDVLAYHQYFCQKVRNNQENRQNEGSPSRKRIMPAI